MSIRSLHPCLAGASGNANREDSDLSFRTHFDVFQCYLAEVIMAHSGFQNLFRRGDRGKMVVFKLRFHQICYCRYEFKTSL